MLSCDLTFALLPHPCALYFRAFVTAAIRCHKKGCGTRIEDENDRRIHLDILPRPRKWLVFYHCFAMSRTSNMLVSTVATLKEAVILPFRAIWEIQV